MKYLILYTSPKPASEQMNEATPEEMEASMAEWLAWKDNAEETLKVEFGSPVQADSRFTAEGQRESSSEVSGYSILEGDSKDSVLDALTNHPHLKEPGAAIEVLEMLDMPGSGG